MKDECSLQQVPRRLCQLQLLDGLPADSVPQARAWIDGRHLDDEPPLAMAHQDHLMERRIRALGIELRHGLCEGIAQQHGGVRDRTPAGEVEEPELESFPHLDVVQKIIEHVGPPVCARRGAVDEHYRDAAWPERLREREAARQRLLQEITEEEPPASQAPRRRLAQRPGERGGWLDLEWDLAAVDGDSALVGIVVDLERRLQQWFLQ